MTKQTIIFRADGSSSIGMGHFTRTLALAEMLNQHFNCIFATRQPTEYQIAEIEKICHGRIDLPEDDAHFEHFLNHLKGSEIIVLDNYYFTTDYQKAIKAKGCKLVCIDDMHDKYFVSDIIINHSPGIKPEDYLAKPHTIFALGLEYVLLRNTFLQQAKQIRVIEKIETLLICFGGSDPRNLTFDTLKVAIEFKEFLKILVVCGSNYIFTQEFVQFVSSDKRIMLLRNLDEVHMLDTMLEAELAILPASGVLLEALAAGCEVISGAYVNNQKYIYSNFLSRGIIFGALDFNSIDLRTAIIHSLRQDRNHKQEIDGNSPARLKSLFIEILCNLREATFNDCELLYGWANDLLVRENAISKEPIDWESHVEWYNKKLKSFNSKIFILEFNGKPAGQVRYDLVDSYWVIDYSISQAFRGHGLGKVIIKLSSKHFSNQTIKAYVLDRNLASNIIFKSLGFINHNTMEINSELYKVYHLNL